MIAILSPAKNMKMGKVSGITPTEPQYWTKTRPLLALLRELSPSELETLMRVNPKIALSACIGFQEFDPSALGTPALAAYRGLAFTNIGVEDFTPADYAFVQNRLRILSAFYGLLRPSDGILPYRLEMQCRLRIDGNTLYAHWGDRLYRDLFSTGEPVVNLASDEYSKAVTPHITPLDRMVTCRFVTFRDGKYKTLATEAKMCRGQMVRYMVKHRLTQPEQLQTFTFLDYTFMPGMSSEQVYTFGKG